MKEIEIGIEIEIETETVRANSTLTGIEIEIGEERGEVLEIEIGTEIVTWKMGTILMTQNNRTETVTGKQRRKITDP